MPGEETAAQLERLSNEWMDAWRRRDRPRLEELLGEGFTLTSARTRHLMDRASWLETAMTRATCESFEISDVGVQANGDAAVVKSRMRQRATVDGQRWDGEFMLTDVWFRNGDRWQVVARHSSTPPDAAF